MLVFESVSKLWPQLSEELSQMDGWHGRSDLIGWLAGWLVGLFGYLVNGFC